MIKTIKPSIADTESELSLESFMSIMRDNSYRPTYFREKIIVLGLIGKEFYMLKNVSMSGYYIWASLSNLYINAPDKVRDLQNIQEDIRGGLFQEVLLMTDIRDLIQVLNDAMIECPGR